MALQNADQNKKELDKYTRNFVTKSLQVIVQSRMGEKCKYTAKENSSLDWFNLPIPDIPELSAVARKTLGTGPVLNEPVSVEISLKTNNRNDYIYLEVWSLSLDVEKTDPNVKVASTVYSRMTLALKTILSFSRVAPAFHLAQRQKKDDFQIHYQYSLGPPNLGILRGDIQTRNVTAVTTPAGTIRVALSYTTTPQMPRQTKVEAALTPKTDHFSDPRGSRTSEPKPCNRKFRNPTSVEDLRFLESQEKQDTFSTTFSTSPPDGAICCVSPPPLPLISETSDTLLDSTEGATCKQATGASTRNKRAADGAKAKQAKSPESEVNPFEALFDNSGLFCGEGKPFLIEKPENRPFASLMSGIPKLSAADYSLSESSDEDKQKAVKSQAQALEESQDSDEMELEADGKSQSPVFNDFVVLPPLESPFTEGDPSDLGEFYRMMQLAAHAPLSMLDEQHVPDNGFMVSIKEQIDEFAAMQPQIENFIKSLEDTEEHND